MTELDPLDLAVHRAKVLAHRGLRFVEDRRDPIRPARASRLLIGVPRIAEDRCSLWNREIDPREWPLELGKVENLRVAARALDGLEFEADQPFSFWAQVGPPVRGRGFVDGRELREGCVVPGVGGGLCLLSNGLYAAASQARMTILERHPHSKRPPGSRAALGEDATVAWNYVDLRFVGAYPWRLEVELDSEQLVVAIRSARVGPERRKSVRIVADARPDQGPSCLACDQPCEFAKPADLAAKIHERRTWLLDAVWPEYAAYLRDHARADDRLAIPIDAGPLGPTRYTWPRVAVGERRQFPIQTLLRSLRSRQLASQGPERQRALLDDDRRLATAMAASLTADDTELVVAHNLVAHLRRLGALGGRRVTVLMQRLPLVDLHARLDRAKQRWPESPTLADFRADARLLDDEARGLELATELVSPHADLADSPSCVGKLRLLDWALPCEPRPSPRTRPRGRLQLYFPASTVGRKGAHELRAALANIDCTLWIAGRELEGPNFWPASVHVEQRPANLATIDAVVLPAWVEHQPRELLRAVAAGVPVIASRACGLGSLAGVRTTETGDIDDLARAIAELHR